MGDMGDMGTYEDRFDRLKAFDEDKNNIIEDLLQYLRNVRASLNSKEKEVERATICTSHFQEQLKLKEAEARERQQEIAQLAFVSVLIDGDCMNFNDELVQKGAAGGHEAIRLLKSAVLRYIREIEPQAPANIQINIYVFANVKGLVDTYRRANIISNGSTFEAFKQGFNMEDGLCDIIDAGDGKECSDEKLKARFHQHILDIHCHHIVFGGSADNGYTRLLNPYEGTKHVTLLEGPPFGRELAELAPKFRTISFEAIFRSEKLLARKVPSSMTPPRTHPPNYASVTRNSPPSPVLQAAAFPGAGPAEMMIKSNVSRNAKGQRVDRPLRFFQIDLNGLKRLKLCNQYHILGNCYRGEHCTYPHGERLTGPKLEALKHLSRGTSCPRGTDCQDEDCVAGHRCQKSSCEPVTCWFPREMHGVDTVIVG